MELIQLNEHTWVVQGGANIGVIAHKGRCLIIDSGIDKDTGQGILKQVKKLGLTPTALLITHAHADHTGGAQQLVRQTGLKVFATRIEAAVMSSPILEPLYLFGGAQPPRELQHKFFLAKPCLADSILVGNEQVIDQIPLEVISLPGHSTEQVGIAFGDTFFTGDAFLTPDILDKHRIPFYTDIATGLTTLDTLKGRVSSFAHIVAGHGEIYTSPAKSIQAIEYTVERLEHILEQTRTALAYGEARQASEVLRAVAEAQGASITTLSQHVLYTTTVQAALSALYARGEVHPVFADNYMLWQRQQ
ncbi:MAG TPA: MBL fold metallo-hydrolase [Ktedonobacteraceae bacterium]|nr:MBL fold metallo-hydrolase [Ktedonobacteraceae bacterium]